MTHTPPPSLPRTIDDCLHAELRAACRGWLREHTDDILQATHLRLIHRARRRPDQQITSAYARRAARNAVIDTVRRRGRHDALWLVHRAAAPTSSPARTPEQVLLDRELAEEIGSQLRRLEPQRREVVLLYLQGHGVSEIAERLGHPRKRIDNHVYRGLAKLRDALTARGLRPTSTAA